MNIKNILNLTLLVTLLVSCGKESKCKLKTTIENQNIQSPFKYITSIAVDNCYIYSSSLDRMLMLMVRDKISKKPIINIKNHQWFISSIALDDNHIYTTSQDKTVKIWNKENGKLIRSLDNKKKESTVLAIDNKYIYLSSKGKPEMIDYFLRIYLSNREVFRNECNGTTCLVEFTVELGIYFEEGVKKGDLRDQDFFSAFGLFMGYLGGIVFLYGEKMLTLELDQYAESVSSNIYRALSV